MVPRCRGAITPSPIEDSTIACGNFICRYRTLGERLSPYASLLQMTAGNRAIGQIFAREPHRFAELRRLHCP